MTQHAGTRLPDWTAGGPDRRPASRPVPAGTTAAAATAALARVVGLLAGETEVAVGRRAGGPAELVRVELADGSWADLLAAVAAATAEPLDRPVEAGLAVGGPGPAGWAAVEVELTADLLAVRADPARFGPGWADRVAGYLARALAAAAADPAGRYAAVDLLDPIERDHLLHGRGGPERPLPDRPYGELVAERARRHPDAVAVAYPGREVSYGWLDAAADRVAHGLLAAGLVAEDVVAVGTSRHPEWVAAILGVLRAGGVYLPVEPEHPAERVGTVLDRSGCRFVLTEPGGLAGTGDRWSRPVAELLAADRPAGPPAVRIDPARAAYIYFTSGSTGQPKGAVCEHRGMANHLAAKIADLGLGPDDVVVQNAEQSFDISLWQFAAPLLVGARALVVPRSDILDVRRFLATVIGGGATVLQVVPSYLDVLLRHLERHPEQDLGRLRAVSVTGEAVGKPLVARFFARCPGLALVNAYGATEASDDTTHEVMTAVPAEALVPVGRPVQNVTVYVLGPGDTLPPLGAPGEIAFSGVCVGRGYVNDPERTAEAFGPDPFRPGERMYRTGDFGRWLPTGSVEFHGRRDEQVKVNGIRIELGEVSARVLSHPGVDSAAVVVTPLPGVGKSLVAFYTSPSGVDADELRAHLAAGLPANAVPARLHRLDALPLTANGKVDKRRLITRAPASGPSTVDGARPATATERRLAEAFAQALDRPVEAIDREADFFALGGGSLSALRVVAGLGGLVSLADLLRAPVLRELAAVADRSGG